MTFDDIRFYLSLFLRRWLAFWSCTILVGGAGIFAALQLPPVFMAEARLVVEAEKIPDELAASTVQTQAYAHLEIIEQRLLSRESLLDLSSRLAIYGNERPTPDAIVEDLRDRIVYTIDGEANPRPNSQTATMLILAFEDENAATSATVVNELVSLVMAEDVQMRTDVARQTLDFFEQEVSRLQNELSRSGATLLSFQQENPTALPGSMASQRERLLVLEAEVSRIVRDSEDLRRERDRLTRLHEANRRREAQARGQGPSFEERQIEALRETLESLPAGDPGADDIANRIASLTRIVARKAEDAADAAGRTAYHDRVDQIDEQLRAFQDQRLDIVTEMDEIRTALAAAPEKSARLASLERDHETLRALFDQAVESKAIAETGDAIEALSKGQRIAIIEQAIVPREPSGPDRPKTALIGVGAGIGLGLLMVLWLELRLGFLRRPIDLERRLGIQPIATLPIMTPPKEPRRFFFFRRRAAA